MDSLPPTLLNEAPLALQKLDPELDDPLHVSCVLGGRTACIQSRSDEAHCPSPLASELSRNALTGSTTTTHMEHCPPNLHGEQIERHQRTRWSMQDEIGVVVCRVGTLEISRASHSLSASSNESWTTVELDAA